MIVASEANQQSESNCETCGARKSNHVKFCTECGAPQIKSLDALPLPLLGSSADQPPAISGSYFERLRLRYQDAYAISRGLVKTGSLIKQTGSIVGGSLLIIGIVCSIRDVGFGIAGIIFMLGGAFAAGGGYIAGTSIAAMGQVMSASIDTAINTSTCISDKEKVDVLEL